MVGFCHGGDLLGNQEFEEDGEDDDNEDEYEDESWC